jgi:fumarylpyruvate hydrolase
MKKQGRPWCIGKGFEASAPIGCITPKQHINNIASAQIQLLVNEQSKQTSCIDQLIWSIPEIIEHISNAWTLQAGDLIFTGTPEGVGAVEVGDVMHAQINGLCDLKVQVV